MTLRRLCKYRPDRLRITVELLWPCWSPAKRVYVRKATEAIRNKFRSFDPAFDEIENYTGFGYCWKKPA